MLTWILIGVGTVVVLAVLATIIGSSLPRDHVATVKANYAAAPEAVWGAISDPASSASWRKGVAVTVLPPVDGKAAWQEKTRSGVVSFVMAESDRPRWMITRITNDDLPFGGQWEFTLAPSGSGSTLTITERGYVKPAMFRFLARTVFGFTSTMDGYLRELGTALSETVTAEVVASGH